MKTKVKQFIFFNLILLCYIRCTNDSDTTLPIVATYDITDITNTSAKSGGIISEYSSSNITARGVCWSTYENPTIANSKTSNGTGFGEFNSSIIGLSYNTTYHVRAYATNSAGTAYGNDLSFTTVIVNGNCGTISDIDGNIYNTVTIGNQCWMKENLKTTRYNDGIAIPNVIDNYAWGWSTTGSWCYYNNDTSNNYTYGKLYNWYAVNTGKLAPEGWHVPTYMEWVTLINNLGGNNVGSGVLKDTTLWNSPNVGATNRSGFSALPAGFRDFDGFSGIGYSGNFWSSTINYIPFPTSIYFQNHNTIIYYNETDGKNSGLSIRCIKDL